MVGWCRYGGTPISRIVIGIGVQQKPQVELYPIVITVRYANRETVQSFSRVATFKDVLFGACQSYFLPPTKV
jgi:hypothetical protein